MSGSWARGSCNSSFGDHGAPHDPRDWYVPHSTPLRVLNVVSSDGALLEASIAGGSESRSGKEG